MRKLLVLADGLHLQDGVHLKLGKILSLAIFLMVLFGSSGQQAKSEVPNGDGDLLWERGLSGRSVNDAVFHPINGNIIAAVSHEIWEIDPKNGHTIRVFEGGISGREIKEIHITNNGNLIIANVWSTSGVVIWNYETGNIWKTLKLYGQDLGIFPNNKEIILYYPDGNQICRYDIYNEVKNDSVIVKGLNGIKIVDIMRLSNDGKFLAIGFAEFDGQSSPIHTMELWDAETLTKIRDFGEASNIHEFRDVQISNDDQYVGFLCSGPRMLYLFNNNNSQLIKKFDNTSAFSFTPNTKIIIYSGTNPEDAQSNIISLPTLDTVYQYIWARSLFRFNENNEMYSGGSSLKLYSNHWYEVGVTAPAGISLKINQISYTRNLLRISTEGIDIINGLIITDTLGKRIYQQNNITITNNTAEIPLILASGNYLLKIVSNGKEYTSKFIVVR